MVIDAETNETIEIMADAKTETDAETAVTEADENSHTGTTRTPRAEAAGRRATSSAICVWESLALAVAGFLTHIMEPSAQHMLASHVGRSYR